MRLYAFAFFCDDSQMTWIIVNIWGKYVYLLSLSCLKKNIVWFLNNKIDILPIAGSL